MKRWHPWEIVLGFPLRRKPNIVRQLKKRERFR